MTEGAFPPHPLPLDVLEPGTGCTLESRRLDPWSGLPSSPSSPPEGPGGGGVSSGPSPCRSLAVGQGGCLGEASLGNHSRAAGDGERTLIARPSSVAPTAALRFAEGRALLSEFGGPSAALDPLLELLPTPPPRFRRIRLLPHVVTRERDAPAGDSSPACNV
jgi:hypothetical protein